MYYRAIAEIKGRISRSDPKYYIHIVFLIQDYQVLLSICITLKERKVQQFCTKIYD